MTPDLAQRLAGFNDTDLGNGERLALLYGEHMRYVPGIGWMVYDGRRWVADAAGMAYRYAKRSIRALYAAAAQLEDDARRAALVKHAIRSERGRGLALALEHAYRGQEVRVLVVAAEDLDADPDLLNVANGTAHLPTGTLRPHDPRDLITKVCPVPYDPTAAAPTWDSFQHGIAGEDADLVATAW